MFTGSLYYYIFSLSIRFSSTGDNNKTRSIHQNTITLKILYCKHHWMQLKKAMLFVEPQQPGDRPNTSPSVEHLTYQAVLQTTLPQGLISDPHTLNHNWFYFILFFGEYKTPLAVPVILFAVWFSPCGYSRYLSVQVRLFQTSWIIPAPHCP